MSEPPSKKKFSFEISLSVLNHLGRNLYRNYITVLGEAISNSWDADANTVWINVSDDRSAFVIRDDGIGMNSDDFQDKFLKIGYSKRSQGLSKTLANRPFIGAKGIGKLALLSVSDQLTILSRTRSTPYIGGVINNQSLDEAITKDLTPEMYALEVLGTDTINHYSDGHEHGTILVFENTKERIRHSPTYLRKLLALSFRFSLLDSNFRLFVNNEQVTYDDLKLLIKNTEFIWVVNEHEDPFIERLKNLKGPRSDLSTPHEISGFLATVNVPSSLKIDGTDERVSVDLFVNGRMRERNIVRRVPTQRVVESYLYGQIHFNALDDGSQDPFTSSREGILEDDENFKTLLKYLEEDLLTTVVQDWTRLRKERGKLGSEEDVTITTRQQAITSAVHETVEEYLQDDDESRFPEIIRWQNELLTEGEYNVDSYLNCFVAENLLRSYIEEHQLPVMQRLREKAIDFKKKEDQHKTEANINLEIRKRNLDSDRLDMDDLVSIVEQTTVVPQSRKQQSMKFDSLIYRPLRNVVCHTGLLTVDAKEQLRIVIKNIGARLNTLIRSRNSKNSAQD